MSFNRIRVSEEATNQLRVLKGRTGLTPNFLCRLALCTSLEEGGIPDPQRYDENGQEFNRYTLTGQWDALFAALVRERLVNDGLDSEDDFYHQYRAHINRGVGTVYGRVKGVGNIVNLL